jgi:hypothetical protein
VLEPDADPATADSDYSPSGAVQFSPAGPESAAAAAAAAAATAAQLRAKRIRKQGSLRVNLPEAPRLGQDGRGTAAARTPSTGRSHQATFHEQQALLQQQKAAAVLGAAAAVEQDQQRQDTWLVFVLAELLGSFIVGPPSIQNPVQSPAPPSTQVTRQQQQQVSPSGAAQPPKRPTAGWAAGGGGAGNSAVSVDLMSVKISYPQFVEILLLCVAVRASGVLDMALAAVTPLALDSELQVG